MTTNQPTPDQAPHAPTPGPAVTTPETAAHPAIPPAEHNGVRDLIIIGSGPAGYTAAIYAARANLHPLVFEGSQFGGALMTTTEVENFPGFPEGIQGPQLMDDMRTQAERFGAELVPADVTEVDLTAAPKIVKVGSEVHRAHAVIVDLEDGVADVEWRRTRARRGSVRTIWRRWLREERAELPDRNPEVLRCS